MTPPEGLIEFLKTRDNFLVMTHLNPDADGLGSSIALSDALSQQGKTTFLLDRDPVPRMYRFLPGSDRFHTFESMKERGINIHQFRDLILIDCNHIDRVVGQGKSFLDTSFRGTITVIDHHEFGEPFGDIRWAMPEAAATGMMIYALIRALGAGISPEMAVNLYAAIMLDTGNFRFENTTEEVLRVGAELVSAGAKPHLIYKELYELWPHNRFDLFMRVLNTLEFVDGVAITTVTRKMLDETATFPDDTETFVAFPRILKDVRVSVLLREVDRNYYRVSLRSKDEVNVALVAKAFGGGGHRNAAGCTISADIETAKALVLKALRSQ